MKHLSLFFVLLTPLLFSAHVLYANILPEPTDIHMLPHESSSEVQEVTCYEAGYRGATLPLVEKLNSGVADILVKTAPLSVEKFLETILQKYSIEKGKDSSLVHIVLRLHPKDWEIYFTLQQEIAKLQPEEGKRPTIDLTLTTAPGHTVDNSIGIAGGTGPLSDSELLKLIMVKMNQRDRNKKIDWKNFAINLYSAPPPRTPHEEFNRGLSYIEGLTGFATRGHNKYFLASNTAHSNIGSFKELVEITRLRRGVHIKSGAVVDLADYVVDQVTADSPNEKEDVLILGTLKGYRDHLYPKYLSLKGFDDASSPQSVKSETDKSHGEYYTVESLAKATELQVYIDMAKEGKITEAGAKVKNFIIDEVKLIKSTQKSHQNLRPVKIILGCTELPMALRGEIMNNLNSDLQKMLTQSEIKNQNSTQPAIKIFNTEELFADKIQEEIETLVSKPVPQSSP